MYEYVNGGAIKPEWSDRQVPVPPQSIRERLRLPKKFQMACLHRDVAADFPATLSEAAVRYLKSFPTYGTKGGGILLAGPRRANTSLVAAALMNELVMRNVSKGDVTGCWMSCFYVLRMILDARQLNRTEMYTSLRNQMFQCDILVVDDLLACVDIDGGRNFVETVYAYREDHNLPVITTVTPSDSKKDLGEMIEKSMGKRFRDRIRLGTQGYRVRV